MTRNIVLLDDDPDEQFVLRDAFAALGIDVDLRQFYTCEKLMQYLDQTCDIPEILLLDVNLPGQTGLECLQIINARDKFSKILTVIYTNATDEQTIAQSFKYGVGVYMKKSATLDKLTENLQTLLAWNIQVIADLPIRGRTLRS
jgi:DNA-binding response OmpR family regulator